MTTTVETQVWQLYEYPTAMACASGDRCPIGGDHALYGGLSSCPPGRNREHRRKAWYPYRSGPMVVLAGTYRTERDAKRAESMLLASGRYLANVHENENNPCRWDFGAVSRGRADRPVAVAQSRSWWPLGRNSRRPRRRRWWQTRAAVLTTAWGASTGGLWWAVADQLPGLRGLKLAALTVSVLSVLAWSKTRRRRRRVRRR